MFELFFLADIDQSFTHVVAEKLGTSFPLHLRHLILRILEANCCRASVVKCALRVESEWVTLFYRGDSTRGSGLAAALWPMGAGRRDLDASKLDERIILTQVAL